jgi:hypothetical protein
MVEERCADAVLLAAWRDIHPVARMERSGWSEPDAQLPSCVRFVRDAGVSAAGG